MDTAKITAVSIMLKLQAEELAAAVLQLNDLKFMVPAADMALSSFVECEPIVSLRRTFVNESNTTTSKSF